MLAEIPSLFSPLSIAVLLALLIAVLAGNYTPPTA